MTDTSTDPRADSFPDTHAPDLGTRAPEGHDVGCPVCGSHRLRHVSGVRDVAARLVFGKRRYVCSACGWTDWKHRLVRHGTPGKRRPAEAGLQGRGLAILTVAIIGVLLWLAFSPACDPAAPARWDDPDPFAEQPSAIPR